MTFFLNKKFQKIIKLQKDNVYNIKNINYDSFSKSKKNFYKTAIIIIKAVTPGIYRLAHEFEYIELQCNEIQKKLYNSLINCYKNENMPWFFFLLNKLKYNYKEYRLILDEYVSDEDILTWTEELYKFWIIIQNFISDNKEKKLDYLQEQIHCLSFLYLKEEGLIYEGHTIIAKDERFKKGFLVPTNMIGKYFLFRKTLGKATTTIKKIFKEMFLNIPIYDLKLN